jgi:hypothetical protein
MPLLRDMGQSQQMWSFFFVLFVHRYVKPGGPCELVALSNSPWVQTKSQNLCYSSIYHPQPQTFYCVLLLRINCKCCSKACGMSINCHGSTYLHVHITVVVYNGCAYIWVVLCDSKNGYQKDTWLKEISLHVQNIISILNSIMNIIERGGTNMTTHWTQKNTYYNNEKDVHMNFKNCKKSYGLDLDLRTFSYYSHVSYPRNSGLVGKK